VQKTAGLLRGR